jgi:hypothetical protein
MFPLDAKFTGGGADAAFRGTRCFCRVEIRSDRVDSTLSRGRLGKAVALLRLRD